MTRHFLCSLALAAVLASSPVFAAEVTAPVEVDEEVTDKLTRPGHLGLGIGLEFPMVGVLTGVGSTSDPGAGYYLGAALSWEFIPGLAARFYGGGGETFGGRANVTYQRSGQNNVVRQDAQLVGAQIGLGMTGLLRSAHRKWTPFLGIDTGAAFQGYYYDLESRLGLAANNDTATLYGSNENEALAFGWATTVRAGIELELLSWLRSNLEIGVTYTTQGDEPVSNTFKAPDVRAEPESVVMTRMVFSFWVGL